MYRSHESKHTGIYSNKVYLFTLVGANSARSHDIEPDRQFARPIIDPDSLFLLRGGKPPLTSMMQELKKAELLQIAEKRYT